MTASLDELGKHHGTDKNSRTHDYCRVYDELFTPLRDKPIALLELGVAFGQSMAMWCDYFTNPDTVIYGIDNGSYGVCATSDRPNLLLFEGDQAAVPAGWPDPVLDIVIDDASHDPVLTEASFRLWFKAVRPGGLYIVEDISARDISFLTCLVGETANRCGEFGIEWMRFSHDLCIMRTSSAVVFPNEGNPGVILVADRPTKHLWTGTPA